jgi:ribose transport system substrate-binding protein
MGCNRIERSKRRGFDDHIQRLIAAATTSLVLLSMTPSWANDEAGVKPNLKLAFFASGGDNSYQLANIQAAIDTGKQYGASMQTFAAHWDNAQQLNQIMSAINSGKYQGFVIEAINPGTVCSSVKAALSKRISVALTNVQACDALYDKPYPGTAAMVGGQSASVYEEWFKRGFGAHPEGGEFAVLVGPMTQGNTVRAREVLKKLEGAYPQWKMVGFEDTGYTAGPALKKTQDIVQAHPNLKILFSNYSGQTPGAIAALKSAGLDSKVKIYDFGGDKAMFAAVEAGTIQETGIFLPYEESVRGVQAVIAQLSGLTSLEGVKVGEFIDLTKDPKLGGLSPFVSKDNITEYKKLGLPEY